MDHQGDDVLVAVIVAELHLLPVEGGLFRLNSNEWSVWVCPNLK